MSKWKIAVALACVVFFTSVWGGVAAGATFTRELVGYPEPTWGAGEVFLLLGPTHGEVVGEVTSDSGLVAGDYTQIYLSGSWALIEYWGPAPQAGLVVSVVSVEGPISIYTFDPHSANPPASYVPVNGDAFHLIITGESYTYGGELYAIHPKAELTFPDLESLFNFDNAPLAQGLRWRPVVTPQGDLDLLVVPEPGTVVLLICGGLGSLLLLRRRKGAAIWGRREQCRIYQRTTYRPVSPGAV